MASVFVIRLYYIQDDDDGQEYVDNVVWYLE